MSKNKKVKLKKIKESLCEDGREHDIAECPNCGIQFCTLCEWSEDEQK